MTSAMLALSLNFANKGVRHSPALRRYCSDALAEGEPQAGGSFDLACVVRQPSIDSSRLGYPHVASGPHNGESQYVFVHHSISSVLKATKHAHVRARQSGRNSKPDCDYCGSPRSCSSLRLVCDLSAMRGGRCPLLVLLCADGYMCCMQLQLAILFTRSRNQRAIRDYLTLICDYGVDLL
eukprot:6199967-Pleurochrysis_carterae.AAC.4